jgi:tetratricopeptide (TPR) repeat protein
MLAACYRQLNQPEEELEILEAMVTNEANSVELFTRLLEISSASNDWEKTKIYSRRLLGVNPLITAPHRYLSIAAEKTKDDEAAIEALSVLANLDPLDAADIHFRLASALHRTKQLGEAKRQVILSLEQAPRYRDAHALLLKIVREQSGKSSEFNDDSPVESVDSNDSDSIGSDELDSKKELP